MCDAVAFNQVSETSWCRDDYMREVRQEKTLFRLVDAASDEFNTHLHIRPEELELISNLRCQFARWGQDYSKHAKRVSGKFLQDGKGEGSRLSGAGFGASKNVPTAQYWLDAG